MLSAVTRRAFSSATAVRAERTMGKALKDGVENVASKFESTGSIGSKFEKGGDVAEVGEKVGGPFKSDGAIGKQFSAEEGGAVGGTGQAAARSAKQAAQEGQEDDVQPQLDADSHRPNAQKANFPADKSRRA